MRLHALPGAVVGVLALTAVPAASAATIHRSPTRARRTVVRTNYDRRLSGVHARAAAVPGTVEKARSALRSSLGATAVLQTDPVTGGVSSLEKLDGYLTGPSGDDAATIALDYVRTHLDAFGLDSADVDALVLAQRYTSPDGITHLQWATRVDGVAVLDRDLTAAVDAHGQLMQLQGAPQHGAAVASATPALSPRDALAAAQRADGITVDVPAASRPVGRTLKTSFDGGSQAELVAFPTASGDTLAYRVIVTDPKTDTMYGTIVSAASGALLYRESLTSDLNAANVFALYPGAPGSGGTQQQVDLSPWLDAPNTTKVLAGNNAHVFEDVNDDGQATADEEAVPSTTTTPSQWSYTLKTFTPAQLQANGLPAAYALCPSAGCSWNAAASNNDPQSWIANSDENAAQVFYFVNKYHDYVAGGPIGFTAAAGGFEGTDRLNAAAEDGAINNGGGNVDPQHIDNANMSTPPDGQSPSMRMYLFSHVQSPDQWTMVNGGDDATVVMHEYQHGVTGRTIHDASGMQALTPKQAGAMNEAWSDWFSLDYLYSQGLATDDPASVDVVEGKYESLQPTGQGPRSQPLDCPANGGGAACPGPTPNGIANGAKAGAGGYTYGDMGQINGADKDEVHADGEIWGETLWDLRQKLGHDSALAIVAGGLKLTPANPSMLDARNAILQSAKNVGGLNLQYAAYQVFANRGFGVNARTVNADDIHPTQDFTAPAAPVNCPNGVVLDPGSTCPAPPPAAPAAKPAPASAPTPAAKPTTPLPIVQITKKLKYAKSKFAATITCPTSQVACVGTIRLVAGKKTLKSSSFSLKGGKSRAVSLKVTKRALRKAAAKKAKKLTVTLNVIDNDTLGTAHLTAAALVVRIR